MLGFCAGTLIWTPRGPRPVEALRPGERVLTRDSGAQPIRWIRRSRMTGHGALAPVRLAPGAYGAERPLLVSPRHRLLLRGAEVSLVTGETEVLAAASDLVDGAGIQQVARPRVTYIHLMFDRHEVIWAEGVAAESVHLGFDSLDAMPLPMRAEIEALLPELCPPRSAQTALGRDLSATARPVLSTSEVAAVRAALAPALVFGVAAE